MMKAPKKQTNLQRIKILEKKFENLQYNQQMIIASIIKASDEEE